MIEIVKIQQDVYQVSEDIFLDKLTVELLLSRLESHATCQFKGFNSIIGNILKIYNLEFSPLVRLYNTFRRSGLSDFESQTLLTELSLQ